MGLNDLSVDALVPARLVPAKVGHGTGSCGFRSQLLPILQEVSSGQPLCQPHSLGLAGGSCPAGALQKLSPRAFMAGPRPSLREAQPGCRAMHLWEGASPSSLPQGPPPLRLALGGWGGTCGGHFHGHAEQKSAEALS